MPAAKKAAAADSGKHAAKLLAAFIKAANKNGRDGYPAYFNSKKLFASKEFKAIGDAPEEMQCAVVEAAIGVVEAAAGMRGKSKREFEKLVDQRTGAEHALARLLRRALPISEDAVLRLVTTAGKDFPIYLGHMVLMGFLEKYFEDRAVDAAMLRAIKGMTREFSESYYRAQRRRLIDFLGKHAGSAKGAAKAAKSNKNTKEAEAPKPRGSVYEQLLLSRETALKELPPSTYEKLAGLFVPAPEGEGAATSYRIERGDADAEILEHINGILAYAASDARERRGDEKSFQKAEKALKSDELRLRAVQVVVAACAVSAINAAKYDEDDPRAGRFRYGQKVLEDWPDRLGKSAKPITGAQIADICHSVSKYGHIEYVYPRWPMYAEFLAEHAEKLLDPALSKADRIRVLRFRERMARSVDATERGHVRLIDEALHIGEGFPADLGERWSDGVYTDVLAMPGARSRAWRDVVTLAAGASGTKPTAKWLKRADEALAELERGQIVAQLSAWFGLVGKSRPVFAGGRILGRDSSVPSDAAADLLRGLVWLAARYDEPRMAQAIGDLAMACYKMVPGVGARCIKPGTAAVWALSEMKGAHALAQLSRVRQLVKFGTAKKTLDSTLERLAASLKVTTDELHEIAAPDFGLEPDGTLSEEAGEFTLRLAVGPDGATVRVLDEGGGGGGGGVERKSVPAGVQRDHAQTLKDLKAVATDINKMLPAQKDRLERLFHDERTWPLDAWRTRYIDHPLVGSIARRLIWSFTSGKTTREAIWLDGSFVDERGRRMEPAAEATVALWHPIGETPARIAAWRTFLEERRIRQPFKQAHREIYILTDAERRTGAYSNRFAGHIIRQGQLHALCQQRGWKHTLFVLEYGEPPLLPLPRWNLDAHFVVSPIGDESYGAAAAYAHLQTDRVYVTRAGGDRALDIDEIPARAFSEVMRDVDLFVGVGSIGMDPNWADRGDHAFGDRYWRDFSFGDLSTTAQTRRDVLSRLLPRLSIARACTVAERFLVVRGKLSTYKIHLGSGNILMEPDDRYLCIVASTRESAAVAGQEPIFLPFEGDTTLAVILSKAFMLAEDDKIKDASITRQITRA